MLLSLGLEVLWDRDCGFGFWTGGLGGEGGLGGGRVEGWGGCGWGG